MRCLLKKQILLYAFFLSGVIQSLIALSQKLGITSSNNIDFNITGSFGNPGQLGGYIAICCVITICLLNNAIRNKEKLSILLLFIGSVIQCCGLYLADSRAGLVGLMIGIAVAFISYFLPVIKKYKTISVVTLGLVVVFGSLLIYNYRSASADARLLIWEVSANMIADKPLLGHGTGSFVEKYMLYQADYFEKNPVSDFLLVADNAAYPYNEFINITIQNGIVGLLLVVLLFYLAFASRSRNVWTRMFKAGLATLLGFSMFSYPSEVFPLLLFYPLLVGGIGGKVLFSFGMPRWTFFAAFLLIVVVGIQTVKDGLFVESFSETLPRLYQDSSTDINEQSYSRMKYNNTFNDYYMTWLGQQPVLACSPRIKDTQPSCEGYCTLGKYYLEKKDYKQAEHFFRVASNMIPTRIRPKFYLWELYVEEGDTVSAVYMARKALTAPTKIESIYTLRIKRQMREYFAKHYKKVTL